MKENSVRTVAGMFPMDHQISMSREESQSTFAHYHIRSTYPPHTTCLSPTQTLRLGKLKEYDTLWVFLWIKNNPSIV